MVDGVSYSLLSKGVDGSLPTECLNPCIYTKSGMSSPKFCFARGDLFAECLSDTSPPTEARGKTCWDECTTIVSEFATYLTTNERIDASQAILVNELCPNTPNPAECEDLLPDIWKTFANIFFKTFYNSSVSYQDMPSGWTISLYHCGELHCGTPDDVPLTCEACSSSIQASQDLLLRPELLNAIVDGYKSSEFCNGLGGPERCPDLLELVVTVGLQLLASNLPSGHIHKICDVARPGTCNKMNLTEN